MVRGCDCCSGGGSMVVAAVIGQSLSPDPMVSSIRWFLLLGDFPFDFLNFFY